MNIQIQNLKFGYTTPKIVLNEINLTINDSNTVSIVGASGCGKSTLLRLISALIRKEKENHLEGTIFINNLDAISFAKKDITGFMFQETALFPNRSVRENVTLPLQIRNLNINEDVDKILDLVGLKKYKEYLPSQLSFGMKTRVSLAREFVSKPQLLLLDEPFSPLDIKWKYFLYNELEKLRSEYNPMIIIVTHDIQEALLLSNHIIVMGKNGKILKELNISQPLPRVNDFANIKNLQNEFFEVQSLIINDNFSSEE